MTIYIRYENRFCKCGIKQGDYWSVFVVNHENGKSSDILFSGDDAEQNALQYVRYLEEKHYGEST